jgi:hypothetical protein
MSCKLIFFNFPATKLTHENFIVKNIHDEINRTQIISTISVPIHLNDAHELKFDTVSSPNKLSTGS